MKKTYCVLLGSLNSEKKKPGNQKLVSRFYFELALICA